MIMPSHSQRLRGKIALASSGLSRAAQAVWLHPHLRELFPELLFTVHSITRATAPSMRLAANRAEALIGADPVARAMHAYLAEHAVEETGHDQWTIDDLQALGYAPEEVWARVPSAAVAALVGSQYYWVEHVHPVAYLSYIAVLEGPQTLEFIDSVIERTGLPREAFSTHIIHAKLDIHHVRAFEQFLDRLPLTEHHHEILGVNVIATTNYLQAVFEELLARFERRSSSKMPAPDAMQAASYA